MLLLRRPGRLPLSRTRFLQAALLLLIIFSGVLLTLAVHARPAPQHPYFENLKRNRPLVIAHRGGAGLRPENTLEAFSHAARLGADVLELDVRLTKDNALVVMHDATVERTTDGAGAISALTLPEIKRLDAGFRWSPPGNTEFPFRNRGVTIPTLEEVFTAHADACLLIEIKQGETIEIVKPLCELIRRNERTKRTLVASVNHATLKAFRALCSEVATSASANEARDFLALSYTNLTATYTPDFHALQVPPALGNLPVISANFVRRAHNLNLAVHPWTINDQAEMRRLLDLGVDGIITDQPDLLLNLVRETRR